MCPGHWCPAHPSGPPLGSSQHVHVFVLLNNLKLSALLQVQSHKGKWRQTFWLAETVLILAHTVQLAFFAAKGHCQFSFSILSIRMPQSFSAKLFQMLEHQPLLPPGAILSQIQDSVFALVLMRFLPSSVISSACPGVSEMQPVLLRIVWYYLQRGSVSSVISKD